MSDSFTNHVIHRSVLTCSDRSHYEAALQQQMTTRAQEERQMHLVAAAKAQKEAFAKRPLAERQAAYHLAAFAQANPAGGLDSNQVENLIGTLIVSLPAAFLHARCRCRILTTATGRSTSGGPGVTQRRIVHPTDAAGVRSPGPRSWEREGRPSQVLGSGQATPRTPLSACRPCVFCVAGGGHSADMAEDWGLLCRIVGRGPLHTFCCVGCAGPKGLGYLVLCCVGARPAHFVRSCFG